MVRRWWRAEGSRRMTSGERGRGEGACVRATKREGSRLEGARYGAPRFAITRDVPLDNHNGADAIPALTAARHIATTFARSRAATTVFAAHTRHRRHRLRRRLFSSPSSDCGQ